MVKFWGGVFSLSLSLSLARSRSTRSRLSLSPVAWPNPEAERHYCISVTFDGPGLKQIYIPLVDFKRCLNNDASQRRVNEACSGLAASDFKINLIRARDIICAPPSSFCSFALTLCVGLSLPSHNSTFLPFFSPPFNIPSLFIFSLFPHSTPLSVLSSSLPFTPAPQWVRPDLISGLECECAFHRVLMKSFALSLSVY